MNRKKIILIFILIFVFLSMVFVLNAIKDKQKDNIPNSIEKFIPSSVKNFLLENIFYKEDLYKKIERLRQRVINKDAELKLESKLVDKLLHEMYLNGLDNLEFIKVKNKELITSKNNINYKLTIFQTDYLSGNTWPHTKATAYLDEFNENLFLMSKDGVISYIDINELNGNNFRTKIIPNNLKNLISYDDWWSKPGGKGLKDFLINDGKIYISYTNLIGEDCYNTSILVAEISLDALQFEKFFEPPTCLNVRVGHNRWSHNSGGGKLFSLDNDHLLFSHGGFKTRVKAQDDTSVFGKIISINKNSKEWSIVSKGHRNVQGLFYNSDSNLIINTEHGPLGGDEININKLYETKEKNYGWPISSYGEHYGGKEKNKENYEEAPLYKSHVDYGFIEPIKYFVPSIGITDIKKISKKFNQDFLNDYFIGALGFTLSEGDKSIHHVRLNGENNEVILHDVIPINERIRDIHYLEQKNKIVFFIENSASIAILER